VVVLSTAYGGLKRLHSRSIFVIGHLSTAYGGLKPNAIAAGYPISLSFYRLWRPETQ